MKISKLLIFFSIVSLHGFSQDSLLNAVCEKLTLNYSEHLNPNESMSLYFNTIFSMTTHLQDSAKKEFMEKLDSKCPIVKKLKVKPKNFAPKPISEEEILNDVLKSKSDKKWTKEQLKTEIKRMKTYSKESKKFCSKVIVKLNEHVNYSDFKSLTEYQQGRSIARLAHYMKSN